MSHEIAIINNEASMAYIGNVPWHGLGQQLDPDADLQTWAKAAKMDHNLNTLPVMNGDISVKGKHIIYRTDTREGLSVVSNKYKIVQPIEALEFFKVYAADIAEIETAGVLFGGRRYWALARLDGEINIAGDVTKPYMLMATSCDGSLATQVRLTSVRVVCNNTLEMSQQGKADVVVRHSSVFDPESVRDQLGSIYASFKAQKVMYETLASIKLTEQQATEVLHKLYKVPADAKLHKGQQRILELFNGGALGSEAESANGTAYGLLQATTQFYDHEAGRSQDSRLFNAWFGQVADKKAQVANELMLLAA